MTSDVGIPICFSDQIFVIWKVFSFFVVMHGVAYVVTSYLIVSHRRFTKEYSLRGWVALTILGVMGMCRAKGCVLANFSLTRGAF